MSRVRARASGNCSSLVPPFTAAETDNYAFCLFCLKPFYAYVHAQYKRQCDILWHMATTTGRASKYVTHPPQILINRRWRQVKRPFALWRGYFGLIGSKSGFIFRTSCRQQKERDLFFLQELPFFITATCILEGTVRLRSRSGGGGGIGADRGTRRRRRSM